MKKWKLAAASLLVLPLLTRRWFTPSFQAFWAWLQTAATAIKVSASAAGMKNGSALCGYDLF